jgi:hypothetical protein
MKKLAETAIKYFFMMTLCSADYRLNFSLRRGEIWLFLAPYPNPGFSGCEEGPLSPFDVSALAKFRQINLRRNQRDLGDGTLVGYSVAFGRKFLHGERFYLGRR